MLCWTLNEFAVNSRGRFPAGRGVGFRNEAGFRNEGIRGRGNYGGGRGYNRAEFNGRSEFSNNRGNNRGGSSNRGGDGFQKTDNLSANGGRVTRGGGLSGTGTAKNLAPRVPASAWVNQEQILSTEILVIFSQFFSLKMLVPTSKNKIRWVWLDVNLLSCLLFFIRRHCGIFCRVFYFFMVYSFPTKGGNRQVDG